MTLVLHPHRYPEHDPAEKGQVFKGECNRTACGRKNAVWWNIMTHGLYCPECGPRLNFSDAAICAPVREKPTLEQMDDPVFRADIRKRAKASL
jgi:hypothetical protein